jgi:two-component system, NtrC family, response regulator HydG
MTATAGTAVATRGRVLLVEDEPAAVRVVGLALQREGFDVLAASDAASALGRLPDARPDAIVTDYRLPGMSGIDLLRYVLRRSPDTPVVVITAHGDERLAVEAMRLGAFGYLPKPLDCDELALVLKRAVEVHRLRRELREARLSGRDELVGDSEAMRRVRELIADVAATDATALILGETGTGKELVARAIHASSRRAKGRFVAVNCAAIPDTLLEAELFGHTRGAFTGAVRARDGKLLTASGGTLFLDEVGDVPGSVQPKLLRVLEEGTVTPLGADHPVPVDLRLLAATNHDLQEGVRAGTFREDLFYRLNVVPIVLPPLRQRREDIPPLVRHLLPRLAERHGKAVRDVAPDVLDWLTRRSWPGNVRELENTLERLVVLSRDAVLHLPPGVSDALILPFHEEKRQAVDGFERQYLGDALKACGGRLNEVARRTGLSVRQLYTLLRKHHLVKEDDEQLSDPSSFE